MAWRSTILQMAEKHCPAVLTFLDNSAPYDRTIFQIGVASHACLESVGIETVKVGRWLSGEEAEPIMRKACEEMIAKGREWEGVWEPPLPSQAVWEGRDLALRYQADTPLSPKYQYEATLAVNRDFIPCPPKGSWLVAKIDAHGTKIPESDMWEEDSEAGPILEVVDYKSAWNTDEKSLYSIQRKIQAVLAWANWGEDHEALRLRVVNFRTGRDFDTMIYPNTREGAAVMERWREDIRSEIAAREGERIASPGANCFGCPFINQCEAALSFLPRVFGTANAEEMAHSYAVNLAVAASMEPALRRATKDAPIAIAGGYVGTKLGKESKLTDVAPKRLAEFWLDQAKPTSFEQLKVMLPGLVKAFGIGRAQAEGLLKKYFFKDGAKIEEREAFLVNISQERIRPKFGVHREPLSVVESSGSEDGQSDDLPDF